MPNTSSSAVKGKLQDYLAGCFESLKIPVTVPQIQEWVDLIHETMTTPRRVYHSAEHVLEVLKHLEDQQPVSCDPVTQLAILFHDIIYIALDEETLIQDLLKGVTVKENNVLLEPPTDPHTSMVCTVFGIQSSTTLQDPGRNEFLSALVAIQSFQNILPKPQLVQLAMGIEATIPFRDPSVMDRLFEKGKDALKQFCNTTDDSFVENAVRQAVLVANSDIGIFATTNQIAFLDSNWRLMPEWFPSLLVKKPNLSDLQAVFGSLLKRSTPDVTRIFVSFRGTPSPSQLQARQKPATLNLQFLQDYWAIRLLTITLIVELVGGEKPLSDLLTMEQRAAATIPSKPSKDSALYDALIHGRGTGYSWDAKESPLGGALFQALDCSVPRVKALLEQYASSTAGEWLETMPQTIVLATKQGLGHFGNKNK